MFRTCATEHGRYLLRPRDASVSGGLAAGGAADEYQTGHRIELRRPAGVAELVYAPALGAGGRLPLGVRVPPPASVTVSAQRSAPRSPRWRGGRRRGCGGWTA